MAPEQKWQVTLLPLSTASSTASSAASSTFSSPRRPRFRLMHWLLGTFLGLMLLVIAPALLVSIGGGYDKGVLVATAARGVLASVGGVFAQGAPPQLTYLDTARNLTWAEWRRREAALVPPNERCVVNVSLPLVPYEPRSPVRWLHVPKTSTSFLITIMRRYCDVGVDFSFGSCVTASLVMSYFENLVRLYCRDSLYVPAESMPGGGRSMEPIVDHSPLYARDVPHAYGLFRTPTARMVSHYQYFVNRSNEYSPKSSLKVFPTERDFLASAPDQGCQTKMLLGHYCNHPMSLNASHVNKAQSVLNAMRFVGISDYFDLSVELFHATFGGQDHPSEHSNNRPGRVNKAAWKAKAAAMADGTQEMEYEVVQWNAGRNATYPVDDVEEQVFGLAVERFRADLALYLPHRVKWVKPYTPLLSSNESVNASRDLAA